jgi:hypothetical protein
MARVDGSRWFSVASVRPLCWALLALATAGAACSEDAEEEAACVGGGGPVSGPADTHCTDEAGMAVVQSIGSCQTGADVAAQAGEDDELEEFGVFYGSQAYDDGCKYRVSFTHSCIERDRPVTFDVTLLRNSDGMPASGAMPNTVEAYMEDGHISPSNRFTGPERPAGQYAIGPVEFDRPGRWVVRFHFFETCSDIPPDSPHGHTAFYIDVP